MIDAVIKSTLVLTALPLSSACEETDDLDLVSYCSRSVRASAFSLLDFPMEMDMTHSQARLYLILAQSHLGSKLLDAISNDTQLGRDQAPGLREGGLENVPCACYLGL